MWRFICLTILSYLFLASPINAEPKNFLEFGFDLPSGWDGGERVGFSSGDRQEYMLILGKKDATNERYLATFSIFFLPNKLGKNSQDLAKALAEKQADASEITQEGIFWKFTGDPRDNVLKGRATTLVAADKENSLIIIIKDPSGQDAKQILESLKPLSPRAQKILQSK